jgi:hypothetical protein
MSPTPSARNASAPDTTTPSLQRLGTLQKGRAVFRREDRLRSRRGASYSKDPWAAGPQVPFFREGRDRRLPSLSNRRAL